MTTGRLLALLVLSALLGGGLALGGSLLWQRQQPAQSASLPPEVASTDPATAKARPANMPARPAGPVHELPDRVAESLIGVLPPGGDVEEQIVTGVYDLAAPSVVHIQTTSIVTTLFGQQTARGAGSGVIINKEGYILTNTHVVQGAGARTTLTVKMHDGREFEATWQGVDTETDLAVIKLISPPANLPVAALGDSDRIRVGQRAIVIGNPYGFDSSISVGVISALNRTIQADDRRYEGMIQTDAAVNPGNSGGPLLNSRGEVVGINTVIYSQSGGSQGIGFAIPINFARKVVADLITYGKVRRPWLGALGLLPLGPALARYIGADGITSGVLVQEVAPGSPAAAAGMRGGTEPVSIGRGQYLLTGGDIILSVAGQPVSNPNEVIAMIRRMEVGEVVPVAVWRNGQRLTLQITLDAVP